MTGALPAADEAGPAADALVATGITHRHPPRRDPAARRVARAARASGAPGPAPALDDVSFRVAPGETVGIVGRS